MAAIASTHKPTNYDEVCMQQSLLFSDSLKDLKNLRKQLYTAAEYFELSYIDDNQELNSKCSNLLKHYVVAALVNTVDHLGSVTDKVNNLLNDQVDSISGTELHLSCVEQRMQTFQKLIDHGGCDQQLLVVDTPKYHKRYILPVGETMHGAFCNYHGRSTLDDIDNWHKYKNAIQAIAQETPPQPAVGKAHSLPPTLEFAWQQKSITFSSNLSNKERRAASPYQYQPPCSISPRSRNPTTTNTWHPLTPSLPQPVSPNQALRRQQYISEHQKADLMMACEDNGINGDCKKQHRKSKGMLKAFLSRYKAKKDDHLHTYLDNNTN